MEGHTSLSHLKTRLIEKQASQLAAKDAEIAALKAEVERLSAPVSDEEYHDFFMANYATAKKVRGLDVINALYAARLEGK